MARPTKCTWPVVKKICQRLAGGESLISVCASDDLPEKSTVLYWVVTGREIVDVPEGEPSLFSDQYIRAREAGGFSHGDRVIDVVDKVADGGLDPNQAKAMLDGLKWAAERMAPKRHSARQEIDHSSADGSMTPAPALDASKLSTETIKDLMAARASSESDK